MANHYDPGVHIPLIVRNPQAAREGVVSRAMATLADVTPTILDWTGTKGPSYPLPGRSLLPVLEQEPAQGWDEVTLSHVCHEVTMYYPMRTIRTRKYKLIWNINWRSEYPLPIDTLSRATWQETLRRSDRMIGPRSVRKYLLRDEIELYDLEKDPDEVVNLADNSQYTEIRRELSEKLLAFLKRTDDPWLLRHDLPGVGQDDPSPAFLHRRLLEGL
jgi:N-sulfoglucosamine sulfohydrolase